MTSDHPGGVLSWRDVYKAVGDSEERIIAAMKEAVGPLRVTADDHESRLRKLEMDGCAPARDATETANAVGTKLDALTIFVKANTDSRRGMFDTLGYGQKVLLFTAGMIGMVAVLADILSKYI